MADIELVIKISEKAYNALTHAEFDANLIVDEMRKAIANGTPLPKGHGRIYDENELRKWILEGDEAGCGYIDERDIIDIPAIIEADKERE